VANSGRIWGSGEAWRFCVLVYRYRCLRMEIMRPRLSLRMYTVRKVLNGGAAMYLLGSRL